jgi:ankyrin repeat protein
MYLLNQDIKVDMTNNDGLTPLHNAILLGGLEIASLLLEKGADIEAAALNSWSPLHSFCRKGILSSV